mmetsp:Transcript_58952/g.140462  ORF Transcript_58952/g.140462 Transcript_58952/m.140462 type:complete len:251 (-) Transcript_58952:35-787(-)
MAARADRQQVRLWRSVALALACYWASSAFVALGIHPAAAVRGADARAALGGAGGLRRCRVRRAASILSTPETLGADFSKLEEVLKEKDFKAADAETRRLLIELGGEAAVKRGWVYFAEVRKIEEQDMDAMETLWQHYSEGRFGFSPQRKIWKRVRGQFDKFAEEVSWFTDTWKNRNWPDEFIYSLEAPVGHLPLTNCIRGAQVLEELLSHPGIENRKAAAVKARPSKSEPTDDSGKDKPQSGKRSPLSML